MAKQEEIIIKAEKRTVRGKQVSQLRRAGILPGVVYGHKVESQAIQMDRHTVSLQMTSITPTTLVTIDVAGNKIKAFVRDRQRDVLHGVLTHLDFLAVSMTEKLRATVSVRIDGISPAVKDYNGILMTGVNDLQVECLPQDLPEVITVDVSGLKSIGSGLYVRDLKVSDKVKILTDVDAMLVLVTSQGDETAPAAVAEPGAGEPEVVEHGKKEEEE